ncbi:MAG: Por secretion system protein, partial [Flavobacteriaceae bacterium]|nr:Por secretion system protein [Flavobacteriaceae bacterium]
MKAFYSLLILLIPFVGFGQMTYIPDDNFEQVLIDLGLDDIVDDYVYTSSIDTITQLHLLNQNIADLTGIENFFQLIYL